MLELFISLSENILQSFPEYSISLLFELEDINGNIMPAINKIPKRLLSKIDLLYVEIRNNNKKGEESRYAKYINLEYPVILKIKIKVAKVLKFKTKRIMYFL